MKIASDNLWTRPNKIRSEVIKGLWLEGELATISGAYGIGKSPLLAHLTVCLINGLPFLERQTLQHPVITIDLETPGEKYRADIRSISKALGVNPEPKSPELIDSFLITDVDCQSSKDLSKLIATSGHETKLAFLESQLKEKPNATILIDPVERFFFIDRTKHTHVLRLYMGLQELLRLYPKATIGLTFNLRKRDHRRQFQPDLARDPRDWLEEVSGSQEIATRSDLRLGLDDYNLEDKIKVLNGIHRGQPMYPIFLQASENFQGFKVCHPEADLLTFDQQKYWALLPKSFTFGEAVACGIPKGSWTRLVNRLKELGIITEDPQGTFTKV